MTNARELIAMRARIWPALTPAEIRTVNFAALANAAADALARGWTGEEVGSAALENLGNAENLGAVMLTNIRELGRIDPPRTPVPPPVQSVLADIHHGHQASTRTAEHLATIRQTIRRTP